MTRVAAAPAPRLTDCPGACQFLGGISPRMLWSHTASGGIRCVRIGRRVLYDLDDLRAFVERQKGGEK
jgi:hypothetical protein